MNMCKVESKTFLTRGGGPYLQCLVGIFFGWFWVLIAAVIVVTNGLAELLLGFTSVNFVCVCWFIQQIFAEYLLCARPYSKPWKHSSDKPKSLLYFKTILFSSILYFYWILPSLESGAKGVWERRVFYLLQVGCDKDVWAPDVYLWHVPLVQFCLLIDVQWISIEDAVRGVWPQGSRNVQPWVVLVSLWTSGIVSY